MNWTQSGFDGLLKTMNSNENGKADALDHCIWTVLTSSADDLEPYVANLWSETLNKRGQIKNKRGQIKIINRGRLMPHFIVDCSVEVLESHPEEYIAEQIHLVAVASDLFDIGDIKVRVNPYSKYLVGGKRELFIHVFSSIMQGRSTEQRAKLSQAVVEKLMAMFPHVPNIAMNVSEFEKATYCNRNML